MTWRWWTTKSCRKPGQARTRYQRTFVVNAGRPLPQRPLPSAVATGTVRPSTLIGIPGF